MGELSKQLVEAVQKSNEGKTSAFDSIGIVKRVKDGIAYVHLAGGVDETPVKLTVDAKAGDEVQIRVSGGRAWIVGNATAPPTDNTMAQRAIDYGKIANDAAQKAIADAEVASEAAQSASANATIARQEAEAVSGIAQQARTDAGIAKTAADSAMKGLGQVEDVVGVLEWITNHGTMESQAGQTFDENNVYFIVDPNGDYVIGSTHYSLVTNPVVADIDSYYCLSVDRSIQNYVATHIVVDPEGLWIVPDSGGNKVLIATGGTGKRYETAGTYIVSKVGNDDVTLASFTADGVQIGRGGETHTNIDYHSLQLTDKEGNVYFHVSDLRDKDDGYQAIVTETYIGNGVDRWFRVNASVSEEVSAVDGSDSSNKATLEGTSYVFTRPPANGAEVTIIYKTTEIIAKAFTLGERAYRSNIGLMSIAEGNDVTASGQYSHAEGNSTKAEGYCAHAEGSYARARGSYSHAEGQSARAIGQCSHAEGAGSIATGTYSHAEGYGTETDGYCSHAQNFETIAGYGYQTAIGKYNDNQQNNAFEIGNGTDDNNRSNAFAVDWSGNTTAGGDIEDGQGNVLANKADSASLAPVATSGDYDDLSNKPTIPATPNDYVTDSGTTNGWAWRKWASGRMEAEKEVSTGSTWTSVAAGFYYNQVTITPPSGMLFRHGYAVPTVASNWLTGAQVQGKDSTVKLTIHRLSGASNTFTYRVVLVGVTS